MPNTLSCHRPGDGREAVEGGLVMVGVAAMALVARGLGEVNRHQG